MDPAMRVSATCPRCPYALSRRSVGFPEGTSEGQPVTMVSRSGLLLIGRLTVAELRAGAAQSYSKSWITILKSAVVVRGTSANRGPCTSDVARSKRCLVVGNLAEERSIESLATRSAEESLKRALRLADAPPGEADPPRTATGSLVIEACVFSRHPLASWMLLMLSFSQPRQWDVHW